ncbi:homoserine kinase [soil metagenome]
MTPEAARAVTVEAPASSANLGPGYDALAMALSLRLTVTVEAAAAGGGTMNVTGEGRDRLRPGGANRFTLALERGLSELGAAIPAAWRISMRNEIPLGRGLGSSAAATVAGLVAAEALTQSSLGQDRLLALASQLEGHADNAAAVLLGGFVVVAAGRIVRYEPPPALRAVLFIPERELATDEMRAVLPPSVPHADAAHNVGRAALVVSAFANGDLSLLAGMNDDRLHEPYRAAAFPQLVPLEHAAREAGALGAALSGAGSSVLALCSSDEAAAEVGQALSSSAARLGLAGSVHILAPAIDGARVAPTGG